MVSRIKTRVKNRGIARLQAASAVPRFGTDTVVLIFTSLSRRVKPDMVKGSIFRLLFEPPEGSGRVFDWKKLLVIKEPFIITGAVSLKNVINALKILMPYGIDIYSGIEPVPGKKTVKRRHNLFRR